MTRGRPKKPALSPQQIAMLREIPLLDALELLQLHCKQDPTFKPTGAAHSKRLHVSFGGRVIELIITDAKWFDAGQRKGGGGAIDLCMHLFNEDFTATTGRLGQAILQRAQGATSPPNTENARQPPEEVVWSRAGEDFEAENAEPSNVLRTSVLASTKTLRDRCTVSMEWDSSSVVLIVERETFGAGRVNTVDRLDLGLRDMAQALSTLEAVAANRRAATGSVVRRGLTAGRRAARDQQAISAMLAEAAFATLEAERLLQDGLHIPGRAEAYEALMIAAAKHTARATMLTNDCPIPSAD